MFDRDGGLGTLLLLIVLSGMMDGLGDGDDLLLLLFLFILLSGGIGSMAADESI